MEAIHKQLTPTGALFIGWSCSQTALCRPAIGSGRNLGPASAPEMGSEKCFPFLPQVPLRHIQQHRVEHERRHCSRRRVGDWLDRDRRSQEDLASAAQLTGAEGWQADPDARREAAARPVVAEAVRRETARLARLPEPGRTVLWTGEEPLVPGDRVRISPGDDPMEAAVVSAGQAGGTHPDDLLELRMLFPAGPASPPDMGPQVPYLAGAWSAAAASAPSGPTRGSGNWRRPGSSPCRRSFAGRSVTSVSGAAGSPSS